jgi:tRNA-dihydrouridine synthase B
MWTTKEIKIGEVLLPSRLFFAPMAGISNMAIRSLMRKHGAGLTVTEMICSEAVVRNGSKTLKLMAISPNEHPVAIQLFGNNPDSMAGAGHIAQADADIIDINFGCPAKTVIRSGSGSALMKKPELIREIVSKIVSAVSCPVTAKIRSGWDKDSINAVEIAKMIEDCGASAIIVHPRTRSQGFSGHSDWQVIKDVKDNVKVPVIGNGDITRPEDVKAMLEMTNCDAVMIGRGAMGNPWIFSRTLKYLETGIVPPSPTYYERLIQLLDLARSYVELHGEKIACLEVRKYIKWYTKGMQNVTEMRCKAMHIETLKELEELMSPHIEMAMSMEMSEDEEYVCEPYNRESILQEVDNLK